MSTKTNSVTPKFSYSEKNDTKKSNSRMKAQMKNNANPDQNFSSRKGSTVQQVASRKDGMKGLSIGQKVPMSMFDQQYQKPNPDGMTRIQVASTIKKGTKKALKGTQSKFFGL